jgi:hypothetical protein
MKPTFNQGRYVPASSCSSSPRSVSETVSGAGVNSVPPSFQHGLLLTRALLREPIIAPLEAMNLVGRGGQCYFVRCEVVGLIAPLPEAAFACNKVRGCVGQYAERCPPDYRQFFFQCGTTVGSMAAEACHLEGNLRAQYAITRQGSRDGNLCGYTWFVITCLTK